VRRGRTERGANLKVRPRGRRGLILLVLLALLAAGGFWAARNAGRWLVVSDPLLPARAIVVLSGKAPFRAMEAADLQRQGWAPEIWLFDDKSDETDAAFAKFDIHQPHEHDYDQQVLEKLGVPRAAIRVLEPPTSNTVSELRRVAGELRRLGADKVILVTSPVHSRRVRTIWHMVEGDHPEAMVRYDTAERADLDHWWHSTQDVQDVTHEVLGLIDAHLGFVVEPRQD